MKARTRPSCLACAALFDAARPARGGWRFFDACPAHDPNSPENIEKAARAKRAADSAGEVIEPAPSPDPDAQALGSLTCGVCAAGFTFDSIRGFGLVRTLRLAGRNVAAVTLRTEIPSFARSAVAEIADGDVVHDAVCASCAVSQIVRDAADGRGSTERWTVEASQASRAGGAR